MGQPDEAKWQWLKSFGVGNAKAAHPPSDEQAPALETGRVNAAPNNREPFDLDASGDNDLADSTPLPMNGEAGPGAPLIQDRISAAPDVAKGGYELDVI